jgi:hypothetical protein
MDPDEMSYFHRGPAIDASYQVSVHLFLIDRFLKIFFSETDLPSQPKLSRKHLWKVLYQFCSFRPDLFTNIAATGDSCFLSGFGSFGKAVSKEKIFRNRPIRNKNCLWWPCLSTDRDEMRNLHSGSSKFWFIWQNSFRGEELKKISQSEPRTACDSHVC